MHTEKAFVGDQCPQGEMVTQTIRTFSQKAPLRSELNRVNLHNMVHSPVNTVLVIG